MRIAPELLALKDEFERVHNHHTSAPKFTRIMADFAREKGFPHKVQVSKRKVGKAHRVEEMYVYL